MARPPENEAGCIWVPVRTIAWLIVRIGLVMALVKLLLQEYA